MRFWLAIAFLLATPAFTMAKGVLPFESSYCDTSVEGDGVMLNSDGLWSEEDAAFDKVVASAQIGGSLITKTITTRVLRA